MSKMTIEDLKECLPKHMQKEANQELVDTINNMQESPEFLQAYREGIVTYSTVMANSRQSIQLYLDAVKFVSYKKMEHSDTKAWQLTYPGRLAELKKTAKAEGWDDQKFKKVMSSRVAIYKKGDLVKKVLEMSLIPEHIMYGDYRHMAIEQAAYLAKNALSEREQNVAIGTLLTHLKIPVAQQVDVSVTSNGSDMLKDMKEALAAITQSKKSAIESGTMTTAEAGKLKIGTPTE